MAKTEVNKGKYTESEVKDRGCGRLHDSQSSTWALKKATYGNEGVWRS